MYTCGDIFTSPPNLNLLPPPPPPAPVWISSPTLLLHVAVLPCNLDWRNPQRDRNSLVCIYSGLLKLKSTSELGSWEKCSSPSPLCNIKTLLESYNKSPEEGSQRHILLICSDQEARWYFFIATLLQKERESPVCSKIMAPSCNVMTSNIIF